MRGILGTSIEVYGTIGYGGATNHTFAVDDSPPTSFYVPAVNSSTAPRYHQQFFVSPPLSDNDHTLVVTQQTSVSPHANVFMDYFLYTPSGTSSLEGKTLFFDDTNAALNYSGTWSSGDGTNQDLQSTLHCATSSGSSVFLDFIGT